MQPWSISGDYVRQINLCIYIQPGREKKTIIIVKSYRKYCVVFHVHAVDVCERVNACGWMCLCVRQLLS